MHRSFARTLLCGAAALLVACGGSAGPADGPAVAAADDPGPDRVVATTVAEGLASPWGLAFLPDGRALITEKRGTFRLVSPGGGVSAPIGGAPAVDASGQGGLLDVVASPAFADDATIWFAFAEPAGDGLARTAVARAVLRAEAIHDVRVVFRQQPAVAGGLHFGARLALARDGTLFVGLGERGQAASAQALDTHLGKVVRIRTDGGVPADNPFVARAGALPEVWSYGHRNIQGAAIEPSTGRLWTVEHGPRGGDEVDLPAAGANHGWPVITHGRDYSTGEPLGEGTARDDVAPPAHVWVPTSIAPSGMAFVTSARVPAWTGDLFVGALAGRALVRLRLRDGRVVGEQRLLTALGERIRDVRQGPDGALYLLTDSPAGRLMRVDVR